MTKIVKKTPKLGMNMHLYQLVGRAAPTEKKPNPKMYRMTIFARNKVVAKSRFWVYMRKITKAKATGGEILAVNEIFEKKPLKASVYGIWLRYDSRSGTHNMYKEYRDLTLTGAVGQMYTDMAGRHRALSSNIQIIKTTEVPNAEVRRPNILQFLKPKVKFPVIRSIPMTPNHLRSTFVARRPSTFSG